MKKPTNKFVETVGHINQYKKKPIEGGWYVEQEWKVVMSKSG